MSTPSCDALAAAWDPLHSGSNPMRCMVFNLLPHVVRVASPVTGHSQVGSSLVEDDKVDLAKDLMSSSGGKIILPTDVIIADKFAEDAKTDTVQSGDVPDGWMVRPCIPPDSVSTPAARNNRLWKATYEQQRRRQPQPKRRCCWSRVLTRGKCTNCRASTLAPTA